MNLNNILMLTKTQFETIKNGGSVVIDGKTYTYSQNDLYLVQESGAVFYKHNIEITFDNPEIDEPLMLSVYSASADAYDSFGNFRYLLTDSATPCLCSVNGERVYSFTIDTGTGITLYMANGESRQADVSQITLITDNVTEV